LLNEKLDFEEKYEVTLIEFEETSDELKMLREKLELQALQEEDEAF
jgi:hypothetical protein